MHSRSLEDAVRELKARGLPSASIRLTRTSCDEVAATPGADYLLSLTERNLAIAEETGARPVLILVQHGDLASLYRAAEEAEKRGLKSVLDPVLDPIHFGFAESLSRYRGARAPARRGNGLMGTGNLTELTNDADPLALRRSCWASARNSASPTCSLSMSARTRAARFRNMMRRGA